MTYTVSDVARLARVTVRALHHYDDVGLFRPAGRSESGYRIYSDEDLERLQQVLFFRELGFSLAEIKALADSPGLDRGRRWRCSGRCWSRGRCESRR